MEAIKLLIILFGLLFIIERRPMNIIFNFIGLIITVAIMLGKYNTDYISYLLIIIYCSALTIIFGFVIMLTPNENFQRGKDYKMYILVPIIILLTYYSINRNEIIEINFEMIGIKEWNETILNKIGSGLYLEEVNIIKFMVSTIILLLALIALFYILKI